MNTEKTNNTFDPHVSVDCIILGFDGVSLQVLLSHKSKEDPNADYNQLKLPGRLLYAGEDLDEAASDILSQYIGKAHRHVQQFRAFGSPTRTSNPKDVLWLENAIKQKVGRIVTISYLCLVRITQHNQKTAVHDVAWHKLSELNLDDLAFDHGHIIREVLVELEQMSKVRPERIFEMMPSKFTILQLRLLHEQICGHSLDVRNFSKLMLKRPYLKPLEEWETNLSHRPARYYKFEQVKAK